MLLSGSRLVYGIAEQKALPGIFLSISKKTLTPWAAIVAVVLASMPFLFLGDLKTIANLTNFTIFIVFIVVNASVIYFRYNKPVEEGFKVPLNIGKFPLVPLLGIATSMFMIVNLTFDVLLLGSVLVILGIVLYFILNMNGEYQGRSA